MTEESTIAETNKLHVIGNTDVFHLDLFSGYFLRVNIRLYLHVITYHCH